jgi:hypothetical protein
VFAKESYMLKKITSLFFITLPLVSLSAQATTETWEGYKPIEKVSSPFKAVAMASAIEIQSVTLKDNESDNYEVVDTESTKKVTNSKKLANDLRTLQIETCRNQGLKKCPIFTNTPGNIMVSSTGLITNISPKFQLFITSAIVSGGMSGGMATNESGEVIGIACSSDNRGTDPNQKNAISVIFNPEAQMQLWDSLTKIHL